jgi:spore coat polysaccharide biosynthesis predicted glycosyltransferase SpsG
MVFRVDASRAVGLGHLMRGIALAERLDERGVRTVFVTRESGEGDVVRGLLKGYDVEVLAADIDLAADAASTAARARRAGRALVITDLCHRDAVKEPEPLRAYHRALKAEGLEVVTVDDGARIGEAADVVIDPYFRATPPAPPSGDATRWLLGPAYFIFRREFVEAAAVRRDIRLVAMRVLVTIGGADPSGVTVRAARALTRLAAAGVEAKVVLAAGFAPEIEADVRAVAARSAGRITCVRQPRSLAELMMWADVAITGEGLTKYETAVTGTPSLIVSQFEADRARVDEFARAGTTCHVGSASRLSEEEIGDALQALLADAGRREEMSRKGRALVDGRGVDRVIASLFPEEHHR